ncbi:MAG TPA: hypothetical protein VLA31_10710 [Burkholderiaceae bacterium]|nr:hypothetical protein [Burkholderiaceae bacterium]
MMDVAALAESMKQAATLAQVKGVQTDRHLGKSEKEIVERIGTWSVAVRSGDLLRVLDELERRLK